MTVQILTPAIKKEISYWNEQFNTAYNLRLPFEKQWLTNMAFYSGRQYVVWSPNTASISNQALVEPPAPRHRVRVVANKIKPSIRREVTKLTKSEPHFWVKPGSNEPTDVASARIGEILAEYYLEELNFNKIRRQATWWMCMTGTAFLKTTVAQTKKGDLDTAKPVLDSISPFHLFVPNLQEETLERQPWVCHGRTLPVAVVEETYNCTISERTTQTAGPLDSKLNNALGIRTNKDDVPKDQAFIKEFWIMPCKNYPDGAMMIFAGDQLVHVHQGESEMNDIPAMEGQETYSTNWTKSSLPYQHGRYPFAKIDHIQAGRFYSTSVIEDLIPLQVEYNKTRSQIVEAKNRMARPQIYYEKGSLDPRKVTSEPGLMIPINPGFNFPRPSDLVPLPNYVTEELNRTQSDMDDAASQFEITKGRTPPGVEAASAIAYLQEENDSVLHVTVSSIEEATVEIGRQLLCNVQQYVPDDDLLAIVSMNNSLEAEQFKGKDLTVSTDLRVEPGSMAPKSLAARQAFITELMKMGVIPPEKGLRYLQLNETNRLYEEMQVDARQAQRENYLMATGRGVIQLPDGTTSPLPVNEYDNDTAHIYEHALYMKSREFELLPQEIKDIFLTHFLTHKQRDMQTMNITGGITDGADAASSPAA